MDDDGTVLPPCHGEIPHGTQCLCLLLAAAVSPEGEPPRFGYCLHVLQKRWRMTCRHGEVGPPETPSKGSEKWRDLGKMDGVKAILVKNGCQ